MGSIDQPNSVLAGIREVAVIGAGISGVVSAAHLLRQGLNVTVFERSSIAGGVWHYDPRSENEPPYPSVRPPAPNSRETDGHADGSRPSKKSFDEVSLVHAPPGPCYAGLRNNVPTSLMRSTLMDWPEGTEEIVGQGLLEKYIQDLAVFTGAHDRILYDTSVESVSKNADGKKWNVRTRTLRKTGGGFEFLGRQWEFDSVIVASGHYHVPRVPDIPGLKEWKERFPDSVMHSKRYRSPEPFRGKTVLILGAGVSSLDIAREANDIATKIYQSSRGGQFDVPATILPDNAERIGAIDSFVPSENPSSPSELGEVILKDGRILSDVNAIILGTGYITSYPFLGDLQAPHVRTEEADEKIIISSDGTTTHNLHKDIFYIPDPTLVFVGVPYYTSTYSLFDFQAEVVARVLSGQAALPSREEMAREYDERKAGLVEGSKTFHSLMRKEVAYMNGILEWVNRDIAKSGLEPMRGVDSRWLERYDFFMAEMMKRKTFGAEVEKIQKLTDGLLLVAGVASA